MSVNDREQHDNGTYLSSVAEVAESAHLHTLSVLWQVEEAAHGRVRRKSLQDRALVAEQTVDVVVGDLRAVVLEDDEDDCLPSALNMDN